MVPILQFDSLVSHQRQATILRSPNPNNRRHIPEGTRRRLFLEVPVTPLITESDCSGPRRGTVLVLAAGGSHVGAVVTAPVVDETESKDQAGNGQHCADDSIGASIFLGSSNAGGKSEDKSA